MQPPTGLWIPLITPFRDDRLDEVSLVRLVRHYAAQPVDGVIVAATTGEGMTLDGGETERLVQCAAEAIATTKSTLKLYLGLSGSYTHKLVKTVGNTGSWPADGYLIACPYYSRPSQSGLYSHFAALADATSRPILIYNIPYRTGVNLANETMLRLAERTNIVGVKDCCADATQSFDLLRSKPPEFVVLTGEDALFYTALVHGAEGGILASAHIQTRAFARVRDMLQRGDQTGALAAWRDLVDLPRLLFAEPSPAPIKHWLWRVGLIDSPEVRLPMTPISDDLAARIEHAIAASRLPAMSG
jgi:4-hydroxy-tetrahydrodipicolinate synthase